MDTFEPGSNMPESLTGISRRITRLQRQYQLYLDRSTPFVAYRWASFAGLAVIFMLRILLSQGVSLFL